MLCRLVAYRLGTEYNLTDQAMRYVMFATGYQPGTISPEGPTDKQTLDQWTAGVKTRWFANRLQLNIEGFHSTYHNRADGRLPLWTAAVQCHFPNCHCHFFSVPHINPVCLSRIAIEWLFGFKKTRLKKSD